MRKRLSATAILTVLALVPLWVLPAAASPGAGYLNGSTRIGEYGTCPDSGRGTVWGHNGWGVVASEEAAFSLHVPIVVFFDHSGYFGTGLGALDLCGALSRTPSNDIDAALGAPCRRDVWTPGGYYYAHSGKGQLDVSNNITGARRVVQIRDLTWIPSVTGSVIARGSYADDPLTPFATHGTFLMHGWTNTSQCGNDGWTGTDTFLGGFALIPQTG